MTPATNRRGTVLAAGILLATTALAGGHHGGGERKIGSYSGFEGMEDELGAAVAQTIMELSPTGGAEHDFTSEERQHMLGYAVATPTREGGMAAPRGKRRWLVSLAAGVAGAIGAVALASTGSFLVATSLDFMAQFFPGSDAGLGPVHRLLGESFPGPLTHGVLAAW